MTDKHGTIVAWIALAFAIVGSILPVFGVDPKVAAEMTVMVSGGLGILAHYWKVSPDLPLPSNVQQTLGKIGTFMSGTGLFLLTPLCEHLELTSHATAMVIGVVSAIAGSLSAFAVKSPMEKKLAVASAGPLILPIVLIGLMLSGTASAATKTSSVSASKLSVEVHAQVGMLHFDGTLGIGASGCLGYKLSPLIYPIGCAVLEASKSSDSYAGHFGPYVGVAVPAFQQLGLATTPAFMFGWGMFKIGPGEFIDKSKGAFAIAASVPLFGF